MRERSSTLRQDAGRHAPAHASGSCYRAFCNLQVNSPMLSSFCPPRVETLTLIDSMMSLFAARANAQGHAAEHREVLHPHEASGTSTDAFL